MMKKIILAIGLMFGGAVFVNAQEQTQDSTSTQTQTDQYRTDSTSTTTDDQSQTQTQYDSTSTQQSDMYRTEGNTTDSTSTSTEATTTESTTTTSSGTPTTDDQMSSSSSTGTLSQDQEEGEKIEISELPAAVSTKLQSTDYQGWVVSSARKKMWSDPNDPQAASKEVYVIEAKNGSETKKLKFDKDGNEIEHDKDKKDDQK